MIDTLKRFWSAHWRKILSILSVAVYVLLLLFSCGGLHSKAYESFPNRYIPTNIKYTDPSTEEVITYALDPSLIDYHDLSNEFGSSLVFASSPSMNWYYRLDTSTLGSNPIGFDLACPSNSSDVLRIDDYFLRWNVVDMTPYYSSTPSLSYDPSYSPLSYIQVYAYAGNPDDDITWTHAVIEYTTYSEELFTPDGDLMDVVDTVAKQVSINLADYASTTTLYELIDPSSLDIPANSVITAVELNLARIYNSSTLADPELDNSRIIVSVQQSEYPEWARVSNLESFRSFLTSVRRTPSDEPDAPDAPTYEDGYNTGYSEGKNAGLTQNLGVTRWLTEAGDSVLGMRLFQVHAPRFVGGQYTPILIDVTIGNVLSVFLGGFLLIFFLKMFAGG